MAKQDKEFIARMNGMDYALRIAKEKGIEGLEKEIKMRGFLNATPKYSSNEVQHFWDFLSQNLYFNMLTVSATALHEQFGFGKVRLRRWKDYFNKLTEDVLDLDYMGEHYVKLEDYAVEMNEKYDLGINVSMVSACQDVEDNKPDSTYHYAKVEKIIEELKEAGFADASKWLEDKTE